jgi:hypothetical protein
MKMNINILLFLVSICLISSCSEDFQLTEPYKDIPVIYGIIDRSDSTQYFRIEKAFVDENIPATQIAKVADSLYYPNAVVKLYNLTTKKEYTLQRVDASLEGIIRNDGPFAKVPNYLYKLKNSDLVMNSGDSIKIELKRTDGSIPVTATISLVGDMSFSFPDVNTRQLVFFNSSTTTFQWKHKANTSVFDLKAVVYIEEYQIDSQITRTKIIEIPLSNSIIGNSTLSSTTISGSSFYNFFHDKLVPDSKIERTFVKVDYYLTGGGPELGEYKRILNANTGITASQEIPRYTNLSEGYGIFSSVITIVKSITPKPPTVDSLQAHPLTRELNFR